MFTAVPREPIEKRQRAGADYGSRMSIVEYYIDRRHDPSMTESSVGGRPTSFSDEI
jgi:hypothetical protein